MTRLVAKDGGDTLLGTSGDDMIVAGDTNTSPDHILSNGIEYLTGGTGADIFDFSARNADGSDKATTAYITDFQVGIDKIMVEDLKGHNDNIHDLHFSLQHETYGVVIDAGHDRIVLVGVWSIPAPSDFIFFH